MLSWTQPSLVDVDGEGRFEGIRTDCPTWNQYRAGEPGIDAWCWCSCRRCVRPALSVPVVARIELAAPGGQAENCPLGQERKQMARWLQCSVVRWKRESSTRISQSHQSLKQADRVQQSTTATAVARGRKVAHRQPANEARASRARPDQDRHSTVRSPGAHG